MYGMFEDLFLTDQFKEKTFFGLCFWIKKVTLLKFMPLATLC